MRIRKGNQVEVWMQEAGSPVGAWRGGEVTWGNGHSYTLRWHDGGCGGDEVSGRISRKSVRPRPPPAPVPRDLDAGDMVEVFDDDDCLWKCAEVRGAADDDGRRGHFDVKVVGAAKVLTVPPQRLRVRQVLRNDDVWVALHKDNPIAVPSLMQPRAIVGMGGGGGRGKGGYKPMAPAGSTPFLQKRSFGMLGSNNTGAHGNRFEDSTTKRLKQEPPRRGVEVVPVPNVCVNNRQDEMISGEDCDTGTVGIGIDPDDHGDHQQKQHQHKDDDDDDEDDSDSDSSSSSDDSSSGSDTDSDSRTRSMDADEDCPAAPTTRPCNNDQEACNNDQEADQLQLQPFKKEQPSVKKEQPPPIKKEQPLIKKEQPHRDDVADSREIKSEPLKDEMGTPVLVQEHVHRLELEAYAALMKAFHACGDALSWEKEGLLSDLRVHLHVSNDEHLHVLNLILNRKRRTGGGGPR